MTDRRWTLITIALAAASCSDKSASYEVRRDRFTAAFNVASANNGPLAYSDYARREEDYFCVVNENMSIKSVIDNDLNLDLKTVIPSPVAPSGTRAIVFVSTSKRQAVSFPIAVDKVATRNLEENKCYPLRNLEG